MALKSKAYSVVWGYFKIKEDDTSKVICKLCDKQLSRGRSDRPKDFSTSSMLNHLRSMHRESYDEMMEKKASKGVLATTPMNLGPCLDETNITTQKSFVQAWGNNSPNANAGVTQMIAIKTEPSEYSDDNQVVVERPGFRELMDTVEKSVPELIPVLDVKDSQFDVVIVVTDKLTKLTENLTILREPLESYAQIDKAFEKQPILIRTEVVPSGRLIYSSTGPLDRDQDDVRRFADAAQAGIERALSAGCKTPLFVRPIDDSFEHAGLVAALAVLQALYVPLELREAGTKPKVEKLGIWCNNIDSITKGIGLLNALENGRIVARDIGGSDPERMSAPRVEEYINETFKDTSVNVSVTSDVPTLIKEYPLLAAVNRAANVVERHRARLIFLEYKGSGKITKTLFIVGKGITYDTGGADIKSGGVMAGMHRDKCGAAAAAGFMKVLSILMPDNLRVVAGLPMVRNSVGEESYVADEIITSRAGVRVRVGNTDAEGRMVMADVLCKMKELAVKAVNPQLFTIATLTGHAIRAMGPEYSIIMDNGPARNLGTAQKVQSSGDKVGDPFEVSTIRREDFEFHKGKSEYEDVLQSNNQPSTMTNRGHQTPSAFLIMASGLDKHGKDSSQPLPYSHIDIAGSSGPFPGLPTGSPIVALTAAFVLE